MVSSTLQAIVDFDCYLDEFAIVATKPSNEPEEWFKTENGHLVVTKVFEINSTSKFIHNVANKFTKLSPPGFCDIQMFKIHKVVDD